MFGYAARGQAPLALEGLAERGFGRVAERMRDLCHACAARKLLLREVHPPFGEIGDRRDAGDGLEALREGRARHAREARQFVDMPIMLGPVVKMLDRRSDARVGDPAQPANRAVTHFLQMISKNVEDDQLRELADRAAAADAPLADLGVEPPDHGAHARGGRSVAAELDRGRQDVEQEMSAIAIECDMPADHAHAGRRADLSDTASGVGEDFRCIERSGGQVPGEHEWQRAVEKQNVAAFEGEGRGLVGVHPRRPLQYGDELQSIGRRAADRPIVARDKAARHDHARVDERDEVGNRVIMHIERSR